MYHFQVRKARQDPRSTFTWKTVVKFFQSSATDERAVSAVKQGIVQKTEYPPEAISKKG